MGWKAKPRRQHQVHTCQSWTPPHHHTAPPGHRMRPPPHLPSQLAWLKPRQQPRQRRQQQRRGRNKGTEIGKGAPRVWIPHSKSPRGWCGPADPKTRPKHLSGTACREHEETCALICGRVCVCVFVCVFFFFTSVYVAAKGELTARHIDYLLTFAHPQLRREAQ